MSTKYAAYYCEENVWHLCGEPRFDGLESRVVFISNPNRTCKLWGQRASRPSGAPVIWDYHVILAARSALEQHPRSRTGPLLSSSGWEVWDLDTTFGFPLSLSSYFLETFPGALRDRANQEGFSPRFRVIDASTYRREFSSDRTHMHGADGSWCQPPPPWPAVNRVGGPSFMRWTVMPDGDREVVSLDDLQRSFLSNG